MSIVVQRDRSEKRRQVATRGRIGRPEPFHQREFFNTIRRNGCGETNEPIEAGCSHPLSHIAISGQHQSIVKIRFQRTNVIFDADDNVRSPLCAVRHQSVVD
jgi:hypothetical protein